MAEIGRGAAALLPDAALACAYLKRLGFSETQAAKLATTEPLGASAVAASRRALLNDLVRRHMLRIPFESPTEAEGLVDGDVKRIVARVALGVGGGISFDLNPAFVWLLRQLGAVARLSLACLATPEGFAAAASHCVVVVDGLGGEGGGERAPLLLDPGFQDAPRRPVSLCGEAVEDALESLEVVNSGSGAPSGFTKTLHRRRGTQSLCRHLGDPENGALDGAEAEGAAVYAFDPAGDLAFDAEELRVALRAALADKSSAENAGVLSLGLPAGHITLSGRSLRRIESGAVVEEAAVDGDAQRRRLAGELLARPLLSPPPEEAPKSSAQIMKANASQEVAASKAKNFGTVDSRSLAVGGAGAGGGLGLNAPGAGPKVRHFSSGGAGGAKKASIEIGMEIRNAWQAVMDDKDPTGWIYCPYSLDGRSLDLTKGEGGLSAFKRELNDSCAWGGFRCYGVDKRGGVECKRPKFVFVQYKPEGASSIKKAKQASHKGDVKDAICGAHLDVVAENVADLDEQGMIAKLQAATGAHKPNGYEFEEGVFVEADFYGLGIGKSCKGETAKN